ncbi:MAG: hypothetical protein AAF328_03300 [Planctomycetota bacterium]
MNVRAAATACLLLAILGLSACSVPGLPGSPNGLTVRGQLETDAGTAAPVTLRGDFDTAYYRHADDNTVTFVLLEGPEAHPTQAAIVRLFWRPRAGRTPLEETATNCTITYLVFADDPEGDQRNPGQLGLYSGAGFLHLGGSPGPSDLSADMWDAALNLETRSGRFVDLLGEATLTGSFQARRDPAKVASLLADLNQRIYTRLGFPRMVAVPASADPKPPTSASPATTTVPAQGTG